MNLFRGIKRRIRHKRRLAEFEREALPNKGREVAQARNILRYTTVSGRSYAANKYPVGYHTITVEGETLAGQRDPRSRLALPNYDFSGKRVVDIGSNQGGMLHALDGRLKWGVGIDFDHRLVNAANRVAAIRNDETLRFYTLDIEKEPLGLINDLLPDAKADVVFLLAVCAWIRNWREVITFSAGIAPAIFFESNGDKQQQADQIDHLRATFSEVRLLSETSEDDAGHKRRQSIWCENPVARGSI